MTNITIQYISAALIVAVAIYFFIRRPYRNGCGGCALKDSCASKKANKSKDKCPTTPKDLNNTGCKCLHAYLLD